MSRTQRQYLLDILEMMSNAERFVSGMERDDLKEDLKTQLALHSCFVIIGEAASKVSRDLKLAYPDVPWRDMVSMRNLVAHGYWNVNLDTILETIHRDFPTAKQQVQRVLSDLPPDDLP